MHELVYKNNILQSKLDQKWVGNSISETESCINISPGGTDSYDIYFVKDGKEHYHHEIGGGIIADVDIDWDKGKPIKGAAKQFYGDGKLLVVYQGVPNAKGEALLKDGVEKNWDDKGNLVLEILWNKGAPLKLTERLNNGQVVTTDHPTSSVYDNSIEPQFLGFERACRKYAR